MSFLVLDVGRGIQHIGVRSGRWLAIIVKDHFLHWVMHLRQHGRTADSITEILTAKNSTTQVVTTIDVVADIGEAVHTDVSLGVSVDVGITATGKGVEDTSVIQFNGRVTTNRSQEAATIDKLSLSHIRIVVFAALGTLNIRVVQIDSSAVFSIVARVHQLT